METAFKIVFGIAVFLFCMIIIAAFLLIIKITFLFIPEITIMGIEMSPASPKPF